MIFRVAGGLARPALIGLVLAVGFLLHDVGMTANVHATPHVPDAAMVEGVEGHGDGGARQHGEPTERVLDTDVEPATFGAVLMGAAGPSGCEIAPSVARSPDAPRQYLERGTGRHDDGPELSGAADVAAGIDVPTRSAAVRRALFQVYRM